jgi:hypothetical protein
MVLRPGREAHKEKNMTKLVNLTPHPVVIRAPDGTETTIPPDPRGPARIVGPQGPLARESVMADGIPVPIVAPVVLTGTEGLSVAAGEPDTLVIVSALVREHPLAAPWKAVMVSPGTGPDDKPVRDEKGQIVAVTCLIGQPPAKKELFQWSDELGHRSRDPWLLLVKDGKVYRFTGESIGGVVAVRGSDFRKNGKWSHTKYRLELAQGVRAFSGRQGWEKGTFCEGLGTLAGLGKSCDTWSEVAAALGVTRAAAEDFLRAWKPKAAESLDSAERPV